MAASVRQVGDRAVERKREILAPGGGKDRHVRERAGGGIDRGQRDVRLFDRPAAAQRDGRRRPLFGGPDPVARVEREAHRVALPHVGRRAGAGEGLHRVACSRHEEQPQRRPFQRPKPPRLARGLAVLQHEQERAHHHDRRPVDEHRPGVGVRAEDLRAEALADVSPQVKRRVAQAHIEAERRQQHRQADIARARAEPDHEEAGQGNEHHARALRPAQDAGRVAQAETQDEDGDADGPDDEGQHRQGERGVERVARGHGSSFPGRQ